MTRFCMLVLMFLLHFSLNAQVAIEWQNTIGGSLTEYLYVVKECDDGGFICAGASDSNISGDKTQNSIGEADYWIVKLDSLGNIQWQKTIGGSAIDAISSIQPTVDGGFICGGWSDSNISGDKSEDSQGGLDFWVVKIDVNGIIQWQNTIGGNGYDYLNSINMTADGGYICGGRSNSGISGDKSEDTNGDFDYWIVKIDSLGSIQWEKTIGGLLTDDLKVVQQSVDGGFILGGTSDSDISGDKFENCRGFDDYWVVKLDLNGNLQWQKTIGGNTFDILNSLYQTTDGGFICGGESISNISGDKSENTQGSYDWWLVKLDSNGNIQWQNTIGGNSGDWLHSVKPTINGGYICGGTSSSNISGDKCENSNGGLDYWIVYVDSTGNIEWQNTLGGLDYDWLNYVEPTSEGGFICGGWSESNLSADKFENSNGGSDYWVIKLTMNYNLLQGKTYADLNSNNLLETGEPLLQNIIVSELLPGSFGLSGTNGTYYVAVMDTGNFTVYPNSTLAHYTAAPITHTAYFSSMLQTDSLNDFAFQPNGTINDLQITLTPMSPFRPGFDGHYNLHYRNVGTTSLTGTVIFYPDANVTYVSSSVTPTLITPDSVVWQTALLNPFDEGNILVTVNVNTATQIGSQVNSCSKIEPVSGDAVPSDNQSCWEVIVTGSYDPNDILVNRDTLYNFEFPNPPYLEYIIRFQNTGTDTAFTVKVLNPIDTSMFQLNTFETVTTSHPANVTWKAWERNMEFKFDNILLPDSNVNEPLSHGFIRYRIKPKSTLAVGDFVRNNANIYFDFNNPVPTNTTVTEIILPTFVNSIHEGVEFTIAPNPTTNNVSISFNLKRDAKVEVEIFNALGQEVFGESGNYSSGKNQISITTSSFPKGVYYVKVEVMGSVAVKKLVKL